MLSRSAITAARCAAVLLAVTRPAHGQGVSMCAQVRGLCLAHAASAAAQYDSQSIHSDCPSGTEAGGDGRVEPNLCAVGHRCSSPRCLLDAQPIIQYGAAAADKSRRFGGQGPKSTRGTVQDTMRLAGLLFLVVLASCGTSRAPDAFESRAEFPDCGKASYTNARLELAPPGPVECLTRALAGGDEAELRVRVESVEGDDIRWWIRSTGSGEAEVFVDTSGDPNRGGPAWLRYACPELDFGEDGLPLFGSDVCDETAL